MAKPKVSVVALSFNRKELLPPFINSVRKSSIAKDVEIIIVDNASKDGSVELLREEYPKVKLIARRKNIGSGAHNDALKIAKGEYLMFLDSDLKFDKQCLDILYSTAKKQGEDDVLCPALFDYDKKKKAVPSYSNLSKSFYSYFSKPNTKEIQKEVFMSGFIFIHRDSAKKLQYIFDEDYFLYAEDFDLCMRIWLQGMRLLFCPKAKMYNQPPSQTTQRYFTKDKLAYLMERNLLTTFVKVASIKSMILLMPYVLSMRIVATTKDLAKGDLRSAMSRVRAVLWTLFNTPKILPKRKTLQSKRAVSDKEIFDLANEKQFFKSLLN